MRLGLFTDTYPPEINGVANSTNIVFREMLKHGHEVYVICTRTGIFKAVWDEDGRVLRLAGVELKFLYGYQMSGFIHPFALEEIRKLHLDLIHVQTEFGVGIFARQCAREFHIPLIMTYHTTYEDYTHYVSLHSNRLDRLMKKRVGDVTKLYADASMEVIVPSKKTQEALLGYRIFKKINVIPTGLELERFDPALGTDEKKCEIRGKYDLSMDDRLVIYVGRIAEEKALDLVMEGFEKAIAAGSKVRFLIVGGGPDLGRLEKIAERLGITDSVKFAGPIEQAYIPDYYRSADAFISASLSETQGMTFVEALASGLPVMARHDEVLEDLVIEGETGWYFTDAEDLSRILMKLEEMNPEELKRISENSTEQADPYIAETFYNQLMEVYDRVISEYEDVYVLSNVKAKANSIGITLRRGLEKEITLDVSLDDFYEYGLKKGRNVPESTVEILKKNEIENHAYQRCLNKLAVRDRAAAEMRDWLTHNTECDEEQITAIIDRLTESGYLDDESYCENEVLRMKTSLNGNEKIRSELRRRGVDEQLIEDTLAKYSDEEEIAARLAEKLMKASRYASTRKSADVLRTKLVTRGFSVDMANTVIHKLDFSRVSGNEKNNLIRQAEKAKRKYSRKYSGAELKARIYKSCLQQGFNSADTLNVLDGMEFDNEED